MPVRLQAANPFHVKVVPHVAGTAEQFVLQDGNMMLNGGPDCESRMSRIVFIGRNLDCAVLWQAWAPHRIVRLFRAFPARRMIPPVCKESERRTSAAG